jgi:hypothetical protein
LGVTDRRRSFPGLQLVRDVDGVGDDARPACVRGGALPRRGRDRHDAVGRLRRPEPGAPYGPPASFARRLTCRYPGAWRGGDARRGPQPAASPRVGVNCRSYAAADVANTTLASFGRGAGRSLDQRASERTKRSLKGLGRSCERPGGLSGSNASTDAHLGPKKRPAGTPQKYLIWSLSAIDPDARKTP